VETEQEKGQGRSGRAAEGETAYRILFFAPFYLGSLQFALFYFDFTFLPLFTLPIDYFPLQARPALKYENAPPYLCELGRTSPLVLERDPQFPIDGVLVLLLFSSARPRYPAHRFCAMAGRDAGAMPRALDSIPLLGRQRPYVYPGVRLSSLTPSPPASPPYRWRDLQKLAV
jgi:hypothetical protein